MPSVAKRPCDDHVLALFHETHSKTHKRLKINDELCCETDANKVPLDDQNWRMEIDASHNSPTFHLQPWDGLIQNKTRQEMTTNIVYAEQTKTGTALSSLCTRCLAGEPGHIKHVLLR